MTTMLRPAVSALYYVADSPIHGKGLFANTRIKQDTLIGVFEGRRTTRDGLHVLWIIEEDGTTYGIAAENDLKYANHSSKPTAELNGEEMFALRDILPGEEITFHYGDDWDDVV